jgi:hypothetical protein
MKVKEHDMYLLSTIFADVYGHMLNRKTVPFPLVYRSQADHWAISSMGSGPCVNISEYNRAEEHGIVLRAFKSQDGSKGSGAVPFALEDSLEMSYLISHYLRTALLKNWDVADLNRLYDEFDEQDFKSLAEQAQILEESLR